MKTLKKVLPLSVAAAVTLGALAAPAMAEVEASVGLATTYLFRGLDLGGGSPAFSGDLSYSHDSGVYASVWTSSGDDSLGTEYDLIAGWGGEFGGVGVDIGLVNYVYPNSDVEVGDFSEAYLGLSIADLSFYYYDNIAGAPGDAYYTVSYAMGKYSAAIGQYSADAADSDYTHLDLSYAYNDNVSLTLSTMLDEDTESATNDTTLVLSYSMPVSF